MAKGIQDIGDGFGYLYMTDVTGTNILATQPNTVSGVRNMRQQGTSTAPIVANRPAVGTITVNSTAGAGSITAITIYGINQIGANIVVTSAVPSVVAGQIAAAINAFTASPVDFTAQAVNDVVYVFSPANAQPGYPTYNGAVITVSTTVPSIVTTTTDTTNGSTQFGNSYDDVFGFRFYLDADYGVAGIPGSTPASPTSLLYAIEVTDYFTVRGMQSGIVTLNKTVSTDAINTVERSCAITQIITTNQGGASTDNLEYINPANFVEGDILFLRSTSTGQALTVKDRTNASVTSSPNIILTGAVNFVLQNNKSLMLRYTYDNTYGGVFIEVTRSLSGGVEVTTLAGITSKIGGSTVQVGQLYLATDMFESGAIFMGTSSNTLATKGFAIRRVPIAGSYTRCWATDISAPVIGSYYRYYNKVYQNATGSVGTATGGSLNAPDWTVVSYANNTYYQTEVHEVTYDFLTNIVTFESDKRGNTLTRSTLTSPDCMALFQWGNDNVIGNTIIDSTFDIGNINGDCKGNYVSGGATVTGNFFMVGSAWNNNRIIGGASITSNYVRYFLNNEVGGEATIAANGAVGNYFYQIAFNTVRGNITSNTITAAGAQSIEYNTIERTGVIHNNTFRAQSIVRGNYIGLQSSLQNCVIRSNAGSGCIEGCNIDQSSTLTVTMSADSSPVYDEVLKNSTVTLTTNVNQSSQNQYNNSTLTITLSGSNHTYNSYDNCIMTFTANGCTNGIINNITSVGTPTFSWGACFVTPYYSDLEATLDLADPAVYSAGVLTISDNNQLVGRILLTAAGPQSITEIAGLPLERNIVFTNVSAGTSITFTKTAPGSYAGNLIVGAANFVLDTNASGAADQVTIRKTLGGAPTIVQTVKLA